MASTNNLNTPHGAEAGEGSATIPRADGHPTIQETVASPVPGLQDGQPARQGLSATTDAPCPPPTTEPTAPSSASKENAPSSGSPDNPLPVDQSSSLPPRDPRSTQPMSQPNSGSLELKISPSAIGSSS